MLPIDTTTEVTQHIPPVESAPPKSPQECLPTMALQVAINNIGQKEATGHNDGAFVEMLEFWYYGRHGVGAPWCDIFRSWCMNQAAQTLGIKLVTPKCDSSSGTYAFAKAHGLLLSAPEVGCTGLLRGDGGSPGKTHHHTFVVEGVHTGYVASVDGNESNSVCRASHQIDQCDWVKCI